MPDHCLHVLRTRGEEVRMMKSKVLTAVSTAMIFVPWTILPIRQHDWALESPTAEIMVSCYAVFMIFSGIFTLIAYNKAGVKNALMKICLVINMMYTVAGVIFLIMMLATRFL